MLPKRFISEDEFRRFLRSRKDPKGFALENRGLIPQGIRRWKLNSVPGVSREDAEQECMISLMQSAETWNPGKGRFTTHAISGMRRCKRILERDNSSISFDPGMRGKISRYLKWNAHDPSAPIEEFASAEGINVSQAREISEAALCLRNSRSPKDGSALLYGEKAADRDGSGGGAAPYIPVGDVDRKRMRMERFLNAHSSCERNCLRERVLQMTGSLKENERRVLFLHFGLDGGEPMGLKEVKEAAGISREKAKHLLHRALKKLRNYAEEAGMRKDLIESIPD